MWSLANEPPCLSLKWVVVDVDFATGLGNDLTGMSSCSWIVGYPTRHTDSGRPSLHECERWDASQRPACCRECPTYQQTQTPSCRDRLSAAPYEPGMYWRQLSYFEIVEGPGKPDPRLCELGCLIAAGSATRRRSQGFFAAHTAGIVASAGEHGQEVRHGMRGSRPSIMTAAGRVMQERCELLAVPLGIARASAHSAEMDLPERRFERLESRQHATASYGDQGWLPATAGYLRANPHRCTRSTAASAAQGSGQLTNDLGHTTSLHGAPIALLCAPPWADIVLAALPQLELGHVPQQGTCSTGGVAGSRVPETQAHLLKFISAAQRCLKLVQAEPQRCASCTGLLHLSFVDLPGQTWLDPPTESQLPTRT